MGKLASAATKVRTGEGNRGKPEKGGAAQMFGDDVKVRPYRREATRNSRRVLGDEQHWGKAVLDGQWHGNIERAEFLKRLEESLLQKKQQEAKLLENLKDLEQKQMELRNMLAATWPKQEAALRRIRGMKELCEKTISNLYEGRQINIIGEINSVLG
ncbi:hypothetical protein L7F22_028660 [Adiantum nelumboides]|nr:hypothetical protein [Adiantum nelumboides]